MSAPAKKNTTPLISFNDKITRQALGRIAKLGELYDAHTDSFCGVNLFGNDLPPNRIQLTDTQKSSYDQFFQDSIGDKFRQLDVEPELQLSILVKQVQVSGHGQYIWSPSANSREASAAFAHKLTTKYEAIDVNNSRILNAITPNGIRNSPQATHMVVGIQWGVTTIISVKYSSEDPNFKAVDALKAKLDNMNIDGNERGMMVGNALPDFRYEIFADPSLNNPPRNYEDIPCFLKNLPSAISSVNKGKGVPITYTLLPLSAFNAHIGSVNATIPKVTPISDKTIGEIVHIFDEMNRTGIELSKLRDFIQKFGFCITDDIGQKINWLMNEHHKAQSTIPVNLRKVLVNVRQGKADLHCLVKIIQDYNQGPTSGVSIDAFISSLEPIHNKISFIIFLREEGAHYVGKGSTPDAERKKGNIHECFVFFCSWNNQEHLLNNKEYFKLMVKQKKIPCIFADLDANSELSKLEGVPEGNRICHYEGSYSSTDCLADKLEEQKICLVRCTENHKKADHKPTKRAQVDMICPQSMKGNFCSKDKRKWFCNVCKEKLQYDFNHNFHCNCGFAPINAFQFLCSDPNHADPNHGPAFIGFDDEYLTSLVKEIKPAKELNILILGETGVGKSTWINGFANYLTYKTLREAEAGKQIYLVPSQFTFTDSELNQKVISVGESTNESFRTGESCTQDPVSYVFYTGDRTIRLIDTPGIGDTRGQAMDDRNFNAILQYIANVPEIHGICILLKPNNARLNIIFTYCINELLTHLHVSAAVNIAFCFTNARSTFYRPGDTLPPLNKFLDDLKQNRSVEIRTTKSTVYCMDNEAFRFLSCIHAGEKFTEDDRKNFETSWTHSVKETYRMLEHFEEDVPPHRVGETVSLNEARALILTLSKPLADISQNIQDNIQVLDEETTKLERIDLRKADLQKVLMIPQIGLEPKELGYPRTVCTGAKCIETQSLPNTTVTQTIYKQVCHEHCYLTNVQPEIVPNPALQKCAAMDPRLKCRKCSCPWDLHMHITFSQEKITVMVEDPITKQALAANVTTREAQEIAIQSRKSLIKKYKAEQKIIDGICAKFGAFLKNVAIVPYNDCIEEYLKFNIKEVERQYDNTNNPELQGKVARLNEQLAQYQETKRVLEQMMQSGQANKVTAEEIKQMQAQLEALELNGSYIKKLFDATLYGTKTNHSYLEKVYETHISTMGRRNNVPLPSIKGRGSRPGYGQQSHAAHSAQFGRPSDPRGYFSSQAPQQHYQTGSTSNYPHQNQQHDHYGSSPYSGLNHGFNYDQHSSGLGQVRNIPISMNPLSQYQSPHHVSFANAHPNQPSEYYPSQYGQSSSQYRSTNYD
ncbi:hypothetical protein WR25_15646 [Diploscapter pachys]|uniref:G domain-containing protein n=1 Tax=Diploscapter pachys TaxID=2018661 RepID=A0A2A2KUN7_9BILA|nr:hypothetical protein WR25_15646 [Diploscapter pachys]